MLQIKWNLNVYESINANWMGWGEMNAGWDEADYAKLEAKIDQS